VNKDIQTQRFFLKNVLSHAYEELRDRTLFSLEALHRDWGDTGFLLQEVTKKVELVITYYANRPT
jgi:hypothetical protein